MQNHGFIEKKLLWAKKPAAVLLVCAFALAFTLVLGAQPQQALAKSYSMPQTDIEATVKANGDLSVVEQRHFDFSGTYHAVWWELGSNLPSGSELEISKVRIGNDQGKKFKELSSTAFQTRWRTEGYASSPSYSYDDPMSTLYVFFSESDTEVTIEISYTITGFAQAYSDVGEVYWQFVGSGWDTSSENVSLDVVLPMPASEQATAGENVRAWGHGPLDATVNINSNGVVHYDVPKVSYGEYAEARVLFPTEWLYLVASDADNAHQSTARLDSVLSEEQTWADQANVQRAKQLGSLIIAVLICLAVLAWAIYTFRRYGKELKPTFQDEYWRDNPLPGEHPAVAGRVWRFDAESSEDFTATIMHLANQGALLINKGTYEQPRLIGKKTVEDYYLTRVPEVELNLNYELDRKAMSFVFDTIAGGKPSVWLGSIKTYAEDNPEEFRAVMNNWQGTLSATVIAGRYIESYSESRRLGMRFIGSCVFGIGFVAAIFVNNYFIIIPCLITGIVLWVVAQFMSRRTQKGADAYARCEGLKKWLTEFSALDERPATDVKVWGEFMVYAYLFGVAEQAMKELRKAVPELFETNEAMAAVDSYVPWYVWYNVGHGAGVMPDLASAFDTSLSDSLAAVSSALDGASSSGGGFGGGFSGGGGGGFGGGGGGAR